MAYGNVKRNLKNYTLYIVAMIFSVVVYYNFLSIRYNEQLLKVQSLNVYVKSLSKAVIILLLLFLIFFIWFSNSLFLKQMKKEIGIYAFMGVSNSEIALMFSIEIFFVGVLSIAVGLFLGVLFSKLFMMLLIKVSILNVKINFYFSFKALVEAAGTFLVLFILTSIKGYIDVVRSKLIELFNASRKEEEAPKVNYFKGILSIILIGTAYYFMYNAYGGNLSFSICVPISLVLIVLGTYWLFSSFYLMIMKYFIKRKEILYNGINIVSFSNIAFRIKSEYKVLATVALLVTASITAFGTSYSIRYFVENSTRIQKPYTFSYFTDVNDNKTSKKVKAIIDNDNRKTLLNQSINFLAVDKFIRYGSNNIWGNKIVVIKLSDLKRASANLKVKDVQNLELSRGGGILISLPNTILSLGGEAKSFEINKIKYSVDKEIKTPLFGVGVPAFTLVVKDEDYNTIKNSFKEYNFRGIRVNNPENTISLANKLKKVEGVGKTLFAPYAQSKERSAVPLTGLVYFFGGFLSFVFIIATGSIICFKFLSEANTDKSKYEMLSKIGMTEGEITRAISKQIGISYIFPLIVGIVHSGVAIIVLSKMLKYDIIVPAAISIGIFSLIYGLFFIGTTRAMTRRLIYNT